MAASWRLLILLLFLIVEGITVYGEETTENGYTNENEEAIPNSLRSKRLALRSSDPLTRRSPLEKNFIRFGRSGNRNVQKFRYAENRGIYKREIFKHFHTDPSNILRYGAKDKQCLHCADESLFGQKYSDNLSPRLSENYNQLNSNVKNVSKHFNPDENYNYSTGKNRLSKKSSNYIRFGRNNLSKFQNNEKQFQIENTDRNLLLSVPNFHGNQEDHNPYSLLKSYPKHDKIIGSTADHFGRFGRRDENFIRYGRLTHNGWLARFFPTYQNFKRLNRTNEFDRSVRRNDNFIRLGRPSDKFNKLDRSIRKSDSSFMRLGRQRNRVDELDRTVRRSDNFIRLGRPSDKFNKLDRSIRKSDSSFMRLGRQGNRVDELDRTARRSDNFIRLGRPSDKSNKLDRSVRRSDNFIGLGRLPDRYNELERSIRKSDSSFMRLGRQGSGVDELDRSVRRSDNFIRLGRPSDNSNKLDRSIRRSDNFIRLGRPLDKYNELDRSIRESDSRFMRLGHQGRGVDEFNRSVRRSDGFIRLGRQTDNSDKFGRSIRRTDGKSMLPGDQVDNADKFSKLGDTSFIRPVRSADNPIYFGRSVRRSGGFIPLGRLEDNSDQLERFPRRSDGFIRLGRLTDNVDEFDRSLRRSGNFIRLGRLSEGFENFDRATRKSDGFLGFGRLDIPIDFSKFPRYGRKNQNYIRYGREADNSDYFDRLIRRSSENFMRLGRGKPHDTGIIDTEKERSNSIMNNNSSSNSFSGFNFDDGFHRWGRRDPLLRFYRKSSNFMRLGRNSNDLHRITPKYRKLGRQIEENFRSNNLNYLPIDLFINTNGLKNSTDNDLEPKTDRELHAGIINEVDGYILPDIEVTPRPIRNPDNFMRLGRQNEKQQIDNKFQNLDRVLRRYGKYLRFGRGSIQSGFDLYEYQPVSNNNFEKDSQKYYLTYGKSSDKLPQFDENLGTEPFTTTIDDINWLGPKRNIETRKRIIAENKKADNMEQDIRNTDDYKNNIDTSSLSNF